jgi:hypothetical protein
MKMREKVPVKRVLMGSMGKDSLESWKNGNEKWE